MPSEKTTKTTTTAPGTGDMHTEVLRERHVGVPIRGGSSGWATAVVALITIAALAVIAWFAMDGREQQAADQNEQTTQTDDGGMPDELDVNVGTTSDDGS